MHINNLVITNTNVKCVVLTQHWISMFPCVDRGEERACLSSWHKDKKPGVLSNCSFQCPKIYHTWNCTYWQHLNMSAWSGPCWPAWGDWYWYYIVSMPRIWMWTRTHLQWQQIVSGLRGLFRDNRRFLGKNTLSISQVVDINVLISFCWTRASVLDYISGSVYRPSLRPLANTDLVFRSDQGKRCEFYKHSLYPRLECVGWCWAEHWRGREWSSLCPSDARAWGKVKCEYQFEVIYDIVHVCLRYCTYCLSDLFPCHYRLPNSSSPKRIVSFLHKLWPFEDKLCFDRNSLSDHHFKSTISAIFPSGLCIH